MSSQVKIASTTGGIIAGLLYVGCVAWDLLFPGYAMHAAWAPLLPGFVWLDWGSFVLGLVEGVAYGVLLGWLIVWVPLRIVRVPRA